ncbi:hypothetical protein Purlil1_13185 [Purpureocillium lilacinum]|uniref:Nucleoside phosphorylase domain-containing protein n=1 Tax=Purpureocillium lilacinum TaxID=33203 RepID=A0ABR0BEY9_PURLI|nr:hypothetical protein Purlil1_13185 [Purpureocillium lilacinum]
MVGAVASLALSRMGACLKPMPSASEPPREADPCPLPYQHASGLSPSRHICVSSTVARLSSSHRVCTFVMAVPEDAEPKNRNEYTVDLPNPPKDDNAYTLGSIGPHNIVIACLPQGKYGTNSAATVATRLASTFPSVSLGFMVGIGGGIPPNVRLGDVVVSSPGNSFPLADGRVEAADNLHAMKVTTQGRIAWEDFYGPKLVRLRAYQRRI